MRKAIAKSLGKSKFSAPHYYLSIEVDMDNAMTSRKQINALPDTKVSFNDMVVKASAMALRKHPQINTQWQDDVTKYAKHISIGVAVAVVVAKIRASKCIRAETLKLQLQLIQ